MEGLWTFKTHHRFSGNTYPHGESLCHVVRIDVKKLIMFSINILFIIIYCSFLLSVQTSSACECGVTRSQMSRIYRGQSAQRFQFPWQILILIKFRSSSLEFKYGGVLVSKRHIVTCAHCLEKFMEQKP